MRKFVVGAFFIVAAFTSNHAVSQTLPDTIKKTRSIKPMRMYRDTMIKKTLKKDTV